MTLKSFKNKSVTFQSMVCIALVFMGLIYLYNETISGLINDWQHNDNFSHGFLIPFISGYMIYSVREYLIDIEIKPTAWGLFCIIIGLSLMVIARVGSEYFIERMSLIIVLVGIPLFFFGFRWTKKIGIPLAYLVFMVPLPAIIWNRIAFPMQLFSSYLTEIIVRSIGIPIFRNGNILQLSNATLEVVDACSGLRSLMTMFALSVAFAWFASYSTRNKCLLFLSSMPIAVIANIVRLTITAILSKIYGEQMAQGFLHEFSGIFTFCLGLILLWMLHNIFRKIS